MKNVYTSIFMLFFCTSLLAQGLRKQSAEKYLARLEYFKAEPLYAELAQKQLKKGSGSWEDVSKAALCNYKIFHFDRASLFYSALRKNGQALSEDEYLYSIQSLRFTARYAEALELTKEARSKFPGNSRFAVLAESLEKRESFLQDSALYRVRPLELNSGYGDFAATYTPQGIAYASKRTNAGFLNTRYGWDNGYFLEIFHAQRLNDSTWQKSERSAGHFYSRAHDGPVCFNRSGTEAYITRNIIRKKKGRSLVYLAIYYTYKTEKGWSKAQMLSFCSPDFNTGHAALGPDEKTLYFASDRKGGAGGTDLYRVQKNGDGWGSPENLGPAINTSGNEMFPFISSDGTMLWFSSDAYPGLGGLDIYSVPLAGGKVQNAGYPVNTHADDFAYIEDSTEIRGLFSSNRGDFTDRLYTVKKLPVRINLEGAVYIVYEENGIPEPAGEAKVILSAGEDGQLLALGEHADFAELLEKNREYVLTAELEDHELLKQELFSTGGINRNTVVKRDLYLKPLTIYVKIKAIDKTTKEVLPGARGTLTYAQGRVYEFETDTAGYALFKAERYLKYDVFARKKGYIDGFSAFRTGNERLREVEVPLELTKISKGEKFKVDNIFYDYNKASLRPESENALDLLAAFILENDISVELSSHTDARGSDTYNQTLSQKRAQSCVDYLISKGVPASKITARGYGESQLINHCRNNVSCSEEEHQQNRRTEIKILEVK